MDEAAEEKESGDLAWIMFTALAVLFLFMLLLFVCLCLYIRSIKRQRRAANEVRAKNAALQQSDLESDAEQHSGKRLSGPHVGASSHASRERPFGSED